MSKEDGKPRKLVGSTFWFNQYMCSKCRRMFFIESKDIVEFDEKGKFKDFQSPCCKPYFHKWQKRMKEPVGIYIRRIKLQVVDIPDEIALVHKRRIASEEGKKDPYADKKEDEDEE